MIFSPEIETPESQNEKVNLAFEGRKNGETVLLEDVRKDVQEMWNLFGGIMFATLMNSNFEITVSWSIKVLFWNQ